MTIRADGVWFYQGSPIGRMPLVKLFAGVLRKDADGRHYLVTPAEKVDVAVEDAPFLAVEMEVQGSGREQTPGLPHQRRRHRRRPGPSIRCGSRWSRAAAGLKPYLLVRGRLEALVTRALYYDLVELAVEHDADAARGLGLWSGGAFFADAGPV